jgi:hypothetical protein
MKVDMHDIICVDTRNFGYGQHVAIVQNNGEANCFLLSLQIDVYAKLFEDDVDKTYIGNGIVLDGFSDINSGKVIITELINQMVVKYDNN